MPNDRDGNALKIDDIVYVPCRIVSMAASNDEYCDLGLETIEQAHPSNSYSHIAINSKQVQLPLSYKQVEKR